MISKINNTFNPSFGAKYISSTNIKKLDTKIDKYIDCKASFVELEPENIDDHMALLNISKNWKKKVFIEAMRSGFISVAKGYICGDNFKIYALTTQNKDFKKLDYEKLLGFADIRLAPKEMHLTFIEVKPEFRHHNKEKRSYKEIGTGIIDSLKKIYLKDKDIALFSVDPEKGFYKKNGFTEINAEDGKFVLKRDTSENIQQ